MGPIVQLPVEAMAYHTDIVRHLQLREPELWTWFSSDPQRDSHNEAVRLDLLKATYRIERDSNPSLYSAADEVAGVLGLSAPITFYQAQNSTGLNMALPYIPGEIHIVLVGSVLSMLTEPETRGVLGHEMTHFALLDRWRDYLIASQLLDAMANDIAAQPAHLASARLFKLYTEVYCDRGASLATCDFGATITALIKTQTGITNISAESYLRQTEEIFRKGHPRSEGVTHPETFIRSKALQLWFEESDKSASEIRRVIEGPQSLAELDLLGQEAVSQITRRLINSLLQFKWFHTESVLAHAKLYFDDFQPSATEEKIVTEELNGGGEQFRDYYCYVLLDFAAADRDLEEAPLAAALLLSDELGIGERFRQLASKELNLRKNQMQDLENNASRIVAQASEEES